MNRTIRMFLSFGLTTLLFLLLTIMIGFQPSALAAKKTHKVPADYATIQEAIDASADGDTILIASGKYVEQLSIDKGITLSGGWDVTFKSRDPGTSVVSAQGLSRVISITTATAQNAVVTIDGFTIENGDATGLGGAPASATVTETLPTRLAVSAESESLDIDREVSKLRMRSEAIEKQGYCRDDPACRSMVDRVLAEISQVDELAASPSATNDMSAETVDCGGGIYSANAGLHVLNSTIRYNIASTNRDGRGGGVCVVQAPQDSVQIADSTFQENIGSVTAVSSGQGGGLYVLDSPGAVIEGNHFELNTAVDAGSLTYGIGGAVMVWESPGVAISGNQVLRNTANAGTIARHGLGGGVYLGRSNNSIIEQNVLHDNLATGHGICAGGGLMVNGGTDIVIADNDIARNYACIFQMDQAGAGGGGLSVYAVGAISITGNLVHDNIAVLSGSSMGFSVGGGLDGERWFGPVAVDSNTFSGNRANLSGEGRGGGASLWGTFDTAVTNNIFTDNVASDAKIHGYGGGLYWLNSVNSTLYRNRFERNLATKSDVGEGGGLSVRQEGPKNFNFVVDSNTFLDNRAGTTKSVDLNGDACSVSADGLLFTNNVVAGNGSTSSIYLPASAHYTLVNNTVVGNQGTGILIDAWAKTPVTLTNNIVVSNSVGISVSHGITAMVNYTLWDDNGLNIGGGGLYTESHSFIGPPAFNDSSGHDYHLTYASVAIDAGDPAGVPPAPAVDADDVTRPQGLAVDIGAYEWDKLTQHEGGVVYLPFVSITGVPVSIGSLRGWAIGYDEDWNAIIVHTANGGKTWKVQGDPSLMAGFSPGDISAVDNHTAWAALAGSPGESGGRILKTTDGGIHWKEQAYPTSVTCGIKGIKGLSRSEAWAASLEGQILHTTDGGDTWELVPHQGNPIKQVNRIDAIGSNVWIADSAAGGAVVHTMDGGATWRSEYFPNGDYPLTLNAFDTSCVWGSGADTDYNPTFYRTTDGGVSWTRIETVGALDHMDDICAAGVDAALGAVNGDSIRGQIFRVHKTSSGTMKADNVTPPEISGMSPAGVTCIDSLTSWVAVSRTDFLKPDEDYGAILHTTDGGVTWEFQNAPTDIHYWKISFVGARR